jgi:hypothetical protein
MTTSIYSEAEQARQRKGGLDVLRIIRIMSHPEASDRAALALQCCAAPVLTVEAAVRLLAAAPKGRDDNDVPFNDNTGAVPSRIAAPIAQHN